MCVGCASKKQAARQGRVEWECTHILLLHLLLGVDEARVEHRSVIVVESDVNVKNYHRFVKLDERLGLVVLNALFGSLQSILSSVDLLDDLQIDLKHDNGNRGSFYDIEALDKA